MALLLERGTIPDDLNMRVHHRVAVLLTAGSLLGFVWALAMRSVVWGVVSGAAAAVALSTDLGLLRFLHRRGGAPVVVVGSAMTLVQNLCKLAATIGALLLFSLRSRQPARLKRGERRSIIMQHRTELQSRQTLEFPKRSPIKDRTGSASTAEPQPVAGGLRRQG